MMMRSLEQDIYQRNSDDIDYSDYSLLNVINETALGNEVTVLSVIVPFYSVKTGA